MQAPAQPPFLSFTPNLRLAKSLVQKAGAFFEKKLIKNGSFVSPNHGFARNMPKIIDMKSLVISGIYIAFGRIKSKVYKRLPLLCVTLRHLVVKVYILLLNQIGD